MKYCFTSQFTDGSFIYQDHEDTSHTTPGKNSFYDVLQRVDDVAIFSLTDGIHVYSVNLHTGQFTVDGVVFKSCDPRHNLEGFTSRRLIYFKRNTLQFNNQLQTTAHDVEYFIGWQANDADGKNIQQTISVT